MRGCSVSVKRLIDNAFWLICKDERKRRNDRIREGGCNLSLHEKHTELFKKAQRVSEKELSLFQKDQGL